MHVWQSSHLLRVQLLRDQIRYLWLGLESLRASFGLSWASLWHRSTWTQFRSISISDTNLIAPYNQSREGEVFVLLESGASKQTPSKPDGSGRAGLWVDDFPRGCSDRGFLPMLSAPALGCGFSRMKCRAIELFNSALASRHKRLVEGK